PANSRFRHGRDKEVLKQPTPGLFPDDSQATATSTWPTAKKKGYRYEDTGAHSRRSAGLAGMLLSLKHDGCRRPAGIEPVVGRQPSSAWRNHPERYLRSFRLGIGG